jgi:hypothetical protein
MKRLGEIFLYSFYIQNAIEALEMHLIIDYEQKATFSSIIFILNFELNSPTFSFLSLSLSLPRTSVITRRSPMKKYPKWMKKKRIK